MKMFVFTLFFFNVTLGQVASDSIKKTTFQKVKPFIIPSALITFGVLGIESDGIKSLNAEISAEVKEHIDQKLTIDDFSQYLPAASVYGLNALGIKGKHNFKDRTIILGTSYLLLTSTVMPLKSITKVDRPDGSSNNSFPSGHTATAFAGAEFLWQEYKDVSVWYGISGYLVASGTGFFRMYNNRHWLTDVAAGAGIGIVSTKLAYLLHPYISKLFYKNENHKSSTMLLPFYNGKQGGFGFAMQF
ncbi:phosphatase PAP2 family protein [Flavobacterium sp.]|uniref:phosphatase PAP2 family protein n=1 Tax=Flavobacterium sp. TaxID=239 RepID=UPI0040488933